jgi:hypothetical protein
VGIAPAIFNSLAGGLGVDFPSVMQYEQLIHCTVLDGFLFLRAPDSQECTQGSHGHCGLMHSITFLAGCSAPVTATEGAPPSHKAGSAVVDIGQPGGLQTYTGYLGVSGGACGSCNQSLLPGEGIL